ncbi:MAG TPA: DUF892 family protein, partial [Chthoniobacterales bacterium]
MSGEAQFRFRHTQPHDLLRFFVAGLLNKGAARQVASFEAACPKGNQPKEIIMSLNSLHDLWIEEMRDLYNAENQLLKALPKMAKAASAPELKQAFESHLEETKTHVERLEEIFEKLDKKPSGKTCKAM